MTVERLMKELKKYNPKAEVKLHHKMGEQALFVCAMVGDDNTVWLEAESDNDMGSEIEARYKNALEEQVDEVDFYMDLLETGIDVEMVRKYMDDETADHMREFCEDFGLIDELPDLSFSWNIFTSEDFSQIKKDMQRRIEGNTASIRVGTICIDCIANEYDDGIFLDYDVYVGGEDTGYGFKGSYPYDYIDGGSFSKEIFDMTYREFKEYAEKVLTNFIVKNDKQPTYSLMEHAKQDLLIW